MALSVITNSGSLVAQRSINRHQGLQQQALERLSSGLRINRAGDDAAGMAISTRLTTQTSGLAVAIRNANDAVSLAQTAEGALADMNENLQRLRELALQAANGTNSQSDRQALQVEADQLIEELDRVTRETRFNGQGLLNGEFQGVGFQVGANRGDLYSIAIAGVSLDTLGAPASAGISATVSGQPLVGGDDSSVLPMAAGDLVINGVTVGASKASDDKASVAKQGSSAIAKVAAINAVAEQTGVVAVAGANRVEGTSVAAPVNLSSTVTLNGVPIALRVSGGMSAEQNMEQVAASINAKSDATGVVAEAVATANGYRVDLVAEDGRNITLAGSGNVSAQPFGLPRTLYNLTNTVTFAGGYTLHSQDGSPVSLGTTTGDIDAAGFEAGTYRGTGGALVGDSGSVTAGGRAALVAGDLTINGIDVGSTQASADTASSAEKAASAISLAGAINRLADATGVTARANENQAYSSSVSGLTASATYGFQLNGVNVRFAATGDADLDLRAIITAVNNVAGRSGVAAETLGSDRFALVAADGRNIQIEAEGAGAAAVGGFGAGAAETYVASVVLQSAGRIELGSITGGIEKAGLRVGSFAATEDGLSIARIDLSSQSGATQALSAIDNALQQVNAQRSGLGAVQNRLEATIVNLAVQSENLQAANGRIQDADFASETANLSRSQVLQQAALAILAQANSAPQRVLSLLG